MDYIDNLRFEKMYPKVSIIILNWNGKEDTLECLQSLYQISYPNYEIILVDNGSTDDSVEVFKEKYPEIKLIQNNENLGFAEGNNIAIRYVLEILKPDYILLLNNDTVVDPDFLDELVQTAETDPNIGVLGPTIYDYKPPRSLQSTGSKILWNHGDAINLTYEADVKAGTPKEVDAVTGCALLTKSEVFKKIGGLNKNYFAYFEEIEWCVRARKAMYKIIYVPQGKIWHKGGATSSKITGFAVYHHTRNRFWFMKQHASDKQYLIFLVYFLGFKFFSFVGWALLNKNKPLLVSFIKGVKDGLLAHG